MDNSPSNAVPESAIDALQGGAVAVGSTASPTQQSGVRALDQAVMSGRPSLLSLAILLGIALRLVQYIGGRSLWLDEVFLSYNIVGSSAWELARFPLKYGQIAPLGFLELEHLTAVGLGPDERVLRVWVLIAGICSVILFARLARRFIPSFAVGAVALFAIAPPLVYYSNEVKPYGFDVLVAVAAALVAVVIIDAPVSRPRWVALVVGGGLASWVSLTAIFPLAGTAAVGVTYAWARRRPDRGWLAGTAAVWMASAAAAVLDSRRRLEAFTLPYLQHYWAADFFPFPPHSLHDATWLARFARDLCAQLFASPAPLIVAACAVVGITVLLRRDRWAALAVVLPAIFALAASALQRYPLSGRLALFLAPLVILGIAAALSLFEKLPRFGSSAAAISCLALLIPPTLSFARNPTAAKEDLRPVVAALAQRRQPGDVIYVYCASDAPFGFYAALYGIPRSSTDRGRCDRAHFDRYRGYRRVWVVSSEYTWVSPHEPPESFARYVATLGVQTDSILATGAWARLYDLSGSGR